MRTCINIITLSHMYAVYSTQYWILLPVVVHSNTHGVLRRKGTGSPGSPSHEHTLIFDLCTHRNIRRGKALHMKSHT